MKLRRGLILSAVCIVALFSLAQVAGADTVTGVGGGGLGPYQAGTGGEFTWYPTGSLVPLVDLYAAVAKNQVLNPTPNFQTFCVEDNEYINYGGTYTAILNSAAVNGGAGGPHPDPISLGTAFLYEQFAKGTLVNYDYTNATVGGRLASAAELQNAIWYLEDEIGLPVSNQYVALVNGIFSNPKLDNNGKYGVAVLNLYDSNNGLAQDQLILVPEPGSMLLLGSTLIGLAGLRRKFGK